jgi:hypothetical protein
MWYNAARRPRRRALLELARAAVHVAQAAHEHKAADGGERDGDHHRGEAVGPAGREGVGRVRGEGRASGRPRAGQAAARLSGPPRGRRRPWAKLTSRACARSRRSSGSASAAPGRCSSCLRREEEGGAVGSAGGVGASAARAGGRVGGRSGSGRRRRGARALSAPSCRIGSRRGGVCRRRAPIPGPGPGARPLRIGDAPAAPASARVITPVKPCEAVQR